jgi:hypothetical protein
MNKRIKELLEQSGLQPYYDAQQGHIEKFVELIVRETCSVLDKAQWDKGEDWVCADGTRIITQMKQNFGVEE